MRKYSFLLILVLSITLCFNLMVLANQKIDELSIVSGSVGGNWYPAASVIAEYFNQRYGDNIATAKPGGGQANPISVGRGDVRAGISFSTFLLSAQKGTDQYDKIYDKNRAIVKLFPAGVHILAGENVPYDDFGEIVKNKYPIKMSACRPADSDYWLAGKILDFYGVSFEDIESWGGKVERMGAQESSSLYKDKHIDVYFRHGSWPSSDILEMSFSRPSKLIKISEEVMQKMVDEYAVARETIPANTYEGIDYDYETVGMVCLLFCREDVPDDIAYLLAKTVIEDKDRLASTNPLFKQLDPYTAWKGLGIDLHPGAKKYFEENGYMK